MTLFCGVAGGVGGLGIDADGLGGGGIAGFAAAVAAPPNSRTAGFVEKPGFGTEGRDI